MRSKRKAHRDAQYRLRKRLRNQLAREAPMVLVLTRNLCRDDPQDDRLRRFASRAAELIVPRVINLALITSVAGIGCGLGTWRVFTEQA
jgi:hypothetical protein